MDIGTVLTCLQVVKTGLDIIERFRPGPTAKPKVQPETVSMFQHAVHEELGPQVARRIRSDRDVHQGLSVLASALGDWQASSTRLCPLLLRKSISWGSEEKNLGFVPGYEDVRFVENAYREWKDWIEQGPKNNEGLLVFLLESPDRQTIDTIRALNGRKMGWYHKLRCGCLDVRTGTFYGPPRDPLEKYALTFGVDTFWNELIKGVGYLVV